MEKRSVDPWKWGEYTNSVQAVEVKNVERTLYCSGQAAIDVNGQPSTADMKTQLLMTIKNLEELLQSAGYDCADIVRLNVYTTSVQDFFSTCTAVYQEFLQKYGIRQATTLLEVKGLFATLAVELEATVVK